MVYLGLGLFRASKRSVLRQHAKTSFAPDCYDRRSCDHYRLGHWSGLEPSFIPSFKRTGKQGTFTPKLSDFVFMASR